MALTFLSCDKSSIGPESGDPPRTFRINFIISDTAGNNLLPYNLPDDPVVNPYSFHASADWNDSIGGVYITTTGYVFKMFVKYHDLMNNTGFQQDSTFNMYPCFGGQCDTVTIFHPIDFGECDAKAVYWGSDTTFNYRCTLIPVQYEE